MINFLTEILGTFFFVSVILYVVLNDEYKSPLYAFPIGMALTIAVFFGWATSGGHYNPAVSFAMYSAGKITLPIFLTYVFCQLFGAILAYAYVRLS
jgi:aquaporin Z